MRLRTEKNYEEQKKDALDFGRNPKGAYNMIPVHLRKQNGVNADGTLDWVLFGTCDTCDFFFAENILPTDADGRTYPCDSMGNLEDYRCGGTVTQIHLKVED